MSNSCNTMDTCQAPLSIGFSRQEYWNGLPFPSPGDLPDPGTEWTWVSCSAGRFFTICANGEAHSLGGEGNKPDDHWLFLLQPWLSSLNSAHHFDHCHTTSIGICAKQFTLWAGALSKFLSHWKWTCKWPRRGSTRWRHLFQHSCTFKSSCDRK